MTLTQAIAPAPAPAPGPGPTRDRVLALVAGRAWTSRELGEALGVDRKTADYHLHLLRRKGLVAERDVHGERRFALALGAPRAFADAQPARTRSRVARVVERRGMLSLDELAREVGASRNLTSYHVRNLAQDGIVRVRRVGNRVVVQAQGLAAQAEVTIGA